MYKKVLFIDRDGTLLVEPDDQQVDCLTKFKLLKNVIPALLQLKNAGFTFVMISNQDGLGTPSFETELFLPPQKMLIDLLQTQGIYFYDILICPHFQSDNCDCRKPKVGLVMKYFHNEKMDFENSYVIGDRQTDLVLAENMGIGGILIEEHTDWLAIANKLTAKPRLGICLRKTNETNIRVSVDLDQDKVLNINTGIGFFDHMLEQLAKNGDFSLSLKVEGDLHVDEHHTVEDCALALGVALKNALGSKQGISRYGFLLPMDESLATVALDLSGRGFLVFEGSFSREKVGDLPTELVEHFFQSLSNSLCATINIQVTGKNDHHKIESIFKGLGRALRQAITRQGFDLPSTKGAL